MRMVLLVGTCPRRRVSGASGSKHHAWPDTAPSYLSLPCRHPALRIAPDWNLCSHQHVGTVVCRSIRTRRGPQSPAKLEGECMSTDAIVAIAVLLGSFVYLSVLCLWLTYATWRPVRRKRKPQ